VLVFGAAGPGSFGERFLRDLAGRSAELEGRAHVLIFNADAWDANARLAEALGLPFPILSDGEGKMAALVMPETAASGDPAAAYAGGLSVVVADSNCRVLKIDRNVEDAAYLSRLADYLDGLRAPAPREVRPAAPVLYVPRVLDQADCRRLIDLYETGGNEATGVLRGSGGIAGGTLAPETKIRRDHAVVEPDVARDLGAAVAKRVVPEILKAFSFRVKYVKEFKIGCYDAQDGGFFRPHRDTFTDAGGRRFAMSLNLNTGDYEGGQLKFPEYGPDLYRPDAGDAVIFSCYLVHEALPVTRGRRFVLLTFFYGEDGESREQPLRVA
jgi:predicted 2-oxoglutarate/Fe(II)-dependent dioxygenase YbiX